MPPLPSQRLLEANLASIRGRIEAARAGSPTSSPAVSLLVVTKGAPADAFDLLRSAGVRDVAENRVAAAAERRARADAAPGGRFVWHGVGHVQRNKAARAVLAFDVFHALDSRALADRLEAALAPAERSWPVHLQVNAADDPDKGGVSADDALGFLEDVSRHPHLDVVGWMTMGALDEDPRPAFRALREVRDAAVRRGIGRRPAAALSMGMSDDFEVAVEEGATVVRIGRAVFDGVFPAEEAPPGVRKAG
jgi:pyridoxal phosphate enzyme (YggS family)